MTFSKPAGLRTATLLLSLGLYFSQTSCTSAKKEDWLRPEPQEPKPQRVVDVTESKDKTAQQEKGHHYADLMNLWSYQGVTGPESWGRIRPEFKLCGEGREQSPINLVWSQPQPGGPHLAQSYQDGPLKLVDLGHNLQVSLEPGSQASLHGQSYALKHIDFHLPSEHKLSGQQWPLEIHLHHEGPEGQKAIVAILGQLGQEHAGLTKILAHPPQQRYREVVAPVNFSAAELLPHRDTHYKYRGSLTTPPCSEGVLWIVLNTPIEFSEEQQTAFQALFRPNNRPLQPLNQRRVRNF